MKDSGIAGLEARGPPPPLRFDAVKPPQLASAASAAASAASAASAAVSTVPRAVPVQAVTTDAEANTSVAPETAASWNTKNMGLRLGADLISAASAASLVAPVISIIDRSIMENASGRRPLVDSLKSSFRSLFLRPHRFLFSKPVALIFTLYGGTYLTANALDTATSTARGLPATHVTSGTAKFAASSAANIGLCIYKDQVFVRLFGPPGAGAPRPVALPSYALFAARDCLTIFASFNVPPLLGPALSARLGREARRHVSGQTLAQFAAPAAVQLVSTPVHLLGLDIYNRPAASWAERWRAVGKNWAMSTAARICRIMPAFGVGGVVNMKVRRGLMEMLV